MAESNKNYDCKSKQESIGKFLECPIKPHVGTTCSVCHKVPAHSRSYYGHLFCIECFHKYIWSPAKGSITCSGDLLDESSADWSRSSIALQDSGMSENSVRFSKDKSQVLVSSAIEPVPGDAAANIFDLLCTYGKTEIAIEKK